jgi:hypothetical protein
MATILSSSDKSPFNSAIICCTTVTTLYILSRGWLFTFGARTDWPTFCCCPEAVVLNFTSAGGSAIGSWRACGCCCAVLLRSAAAMETPGVVSLEEKTLPVVVLGVLCDLFFCRSSFACLQPRQLAGCGFSPSANRQLQKDGVQAAFSFSGHSLCRRPPPYHTQRGGCLQFAQTWPNCWQLWHCVRPFWALYVSTLIAMWQRDVKRKISWDFAALDKVMRHTGRSFNTVPSDGDRRVVDICLTLMMSKPMSISPSEMSCAGAFKDRWRITALMGFRDLG